MYDESFFFTFLATVKTKSNPVYTSCHACLTYHDICQQYKPNPVRMMLYIYILSTSDKWHLTVFGPSCCILWLLCVFCPLVVLCRMMFDKWKLIPQLVYFHFAITLNSSPPPPKRFSNHTSEVYAELKDPFTEFLFQDFLNCRRQSWKSLNYLSFLFKWNTPLFLEINGLNLSMFVSLFKLLFLV